MRTYNRRYFLLLICFLPTIYLAAQNNTTTDSSTFWIYLLLAIVVLILFFFIFQVSDSLLAIEARNSGIDTRKNNFSIFPSAKELFAPRLPAYAEGKDVRVLKQGYDIKLEGSAAPTVVDGPVNTFAVQPPNYLGISPIPKMLVEVGHEVKAGDPIFFDKKHPEILHVTPVSGEVIAINRGAKRSIAEVVILADKEMKYKAYEAFDLDQNDRPALVKYLLASGLWPLFRQRPFNVIPTENDLPRDIFISTFDTAPLAPDLNFVVEGQSAAFQKGLDVLNKLTEGSVYLGLNANSEIPPATVYSEATGVEKVWFHGKHPSGNVGVQIHHVRPIGGNDKVWTLGVQDVLTIGKLFLNQRFEADRMIAVVGAELEKPHYVKTYLGANIGDLIGGEAAHLENVRLISGDVLSGKKITKEGFLNAFDDQLSVVSEGNYFEMFGWLLPTIPKPSISRTFPGFLFPDIKYKADTNTHGEQRAFVVTGQYESVLPMDIYPQHLMKSILINDFEKMEGLGIYELVEEDIALCEFVCTSKQPLQKILRQGLEVMREQS